MVRGAGWSTEATRALILLWGEANVQESEKKQDNI